MKSKSDTLETAMRRICSFLALWCMTGVCAADTFANRVHVAKAVESQREASEYLFGRFFPAIGPSMAGAMKACMAREGASKEKFVLVADVSPAGTLVNVDFEPNSNGTAACLAQDMGSLKAPPPPSRAGGNFPVVIEMKITN